MARQYSARADSRPESAAGGRALQQRILSERLLVLAPHMDDESLACGGTMLLHADRTAVHCLFATDGAGSPAPPLPWLGQVDDDLVAQRRREACAAAGVLGLSERNLQFLDFPDGRLVGERAALERALAAAIALHRPAFVFAPFRFDVHPDHVALNRAARAVLRALDQPPQLMEYFVYHRLRGVPGGDVRTTLEPDALVAVDVLPVAVAKRAALDCYVSQTTLRYPWQDRPILTRESLRQRCEEPELFLATDPAAPLHAAFAAHARRVQLAALAMRVAKPPKDRAKAFLRWALGR